jgi:spermidine/putrescine transport system ATP-binding protein
MRDETTAREILRVEGVTKRFGGQVAVDGLDLALAEGEFVTLLGPSGCGKSTTLRMLGGFERPDEGRVVLGGRDVTRLPPERRNVNMVFQDYALFPHMSVRRNIAFGLELRGMGRRAIAARVEELTAFLELAALAERRPDQLSGGQRQRVALARALAPDPAVLLLDEPLGALDAKLRSQVQAELKQIQRRTSKTFVFVTHDQDEALTMSDRIVVMNAGRVEQDGTPEDLYFRPASRFVAEFVGDTNLLTGRVLGLDGDRLALNWHGLRVVGRAPPRDAPRPGETASASLRLERVRLGGERPARSNAFPARVVARTFRGSRVELELALDGARDASLRAYAEADARPDGPVWVGWEADDLAGLAG